MVDEQLPELILPIEGRDHCLGRAGARYQLVEYGDYECPHCRHVQPIVHELLREFGDDLWFAFRHYPQPKIHPNSVRAAEIAEAADQQAKFWLMHDRLFQHQGEFSEKLYQRLAQELPLDMPAFDRDLASGAPTRHVDEDVESAEENGVGDTPAFFVNGRMHEGSYEFRPMLDALRLRTA
ncbi:MAG: DsbA family protein [Thermoplasmata archaeon]